MKRLVNFRPLLYVFVSLVGGIFCCISAILGNFVPLILGGAVLLVVAIFFVVSVVRKNFADYVAQIFGVDRFWKICLCILVGCVVGGALAGISFAANSKRAVQSGEYQCSGVVAEVYNFDNKTQVLLTNFAVDKKSADSNIKFSLYQTDVEVGDNLCFVAHIYANSLVQDGTVATYILKNNIRYYGYIEEETIVVDGNTFNLINQAKDKIKTVLFENMSEQNAGFAYATICGDKTLIHSDLYSVFKNSGLAHILAVSGLHVGFLVGAVMFLLKLLKIKNKHKFVVVALVLFAYCIVCGFSPSIFRASVMSLCLLLGLVLGERNDTLSNICLAGIIVLVFQPLYLYDVGFLLSFGSVFGIALMSKSITNGLCKIKIPKVLSEMLAVTIAATLGTLPIVFSYFGELSLISLVSNLLVLPLFSIMYVVLLVICMLNLLLPLGFLMPIAEFFVKIIINMGGLFAKVGVVSTFSFDVASAVGYYVGLFLISKFVMLKAKTKVVIFAVLAICLSPYLYVANQPTVFDKSFVAAHSSVDNTVFVATKNNQKILFGVGSDEYDLNNICKMLNAYKIKSLDYVVLADYTDDQQSNLAELTYKVQVENIVVFGNLDSSTKFGLATSVSETCNIIFDTDNQFLSRNDECSVTLLHINGLLKAVEIEFDDMAILQITRPITQNQYLSNAHFFGAYDICFVKKYTQVYQNINANKFVCTQLDASSNNLLVLDQTQKWNNNI